MNPKHFSARAYATSRHSKLITVRGPDIVDKLMLGALWLGMIALVAMALFGAGCESAAVRSVDQQTQLKVAQVTAQAKVAAAKAEAAPAAHPLTSTNQAIRKIRDPLIAVTVIAFVAAAVFFGLSFVQSLSWLSTIGLPVCGAVGACCFAGVIALPFLPWVFLGLAVVLVGLAIYEVISHKGITPAIVAIEGDVKSLTTGAAAIVLPATSTTTATPA